MILEFTELVRPTGPTHAWHPFGDERTSSPDFDPTWWLHRSFLPSSRLLRVASNGLEVARVEMDRDARNVESIGPARMIYFLEVGSQIRSMGIGARVVARLVAESSDARLIASANTAVTWWDEHIGWERFQDHELPNGWVAFVSPPLR